MQTARRENPFTVVPMGANDFVDLNPLQQVCTKNKLTGQGFKDARVFVYRDTFKQGIGLVLSYALDTFDQPTLIKLQKGRRQDYDPRNFDLTAVYLPLKYPHGVKIKDEKIRDLNHLLQFVPPGHCNFFLDLFAAQGLLVAEGVEDDPDYPEQDDDILDY